MTSFSFKIFKIRTFLQSSKCSKTIVELTFTTQKANAYWTGCFGPKAQIISLS